MWQSSELSLQWARNSIRNHHNFNSSEHSFWDRLKKIGRFYTTCIIFNWLYLENKHYNNIRYCKHGYTAFAVICWCFWIQSHFLCFLCYSDLSGCQSIPAGIKNKTVYWLLTNLVSEHISYICQLCDSGHRPYLDLLCYL